MSGVKFRLNEDSTECDHRERFRSARKAAGFSLGDGSRRSVTDQDCDKVKITGAALGVGARAGKRQSSRSTGWRR